MAADCIEPDCPWKRGLEPAQTVMPFDKQRAYAEYRREYARQYRELYGLPPAPLMGRGPGTETVG
jgi:hypothetical protein